MKRWPPDMSLQLVAGHINTPVGPLVTPEDVATALRTGSLSTVAEPAGSILAWLFVESSPQALMACLREAGASLQAAQRLYEETLLVGMPRVAAWEEAVANLS